MSANAVVHPLQPRFAQAITGVLCLEALVFSTIPVVGVALALIVLAMAGPRWSPVAWLFRLVARPPAELEPVAPVRFAQGMAATMLALALGLYAWGFTVAGWTLVGTVAAVALFSAISGICIGCEIYRVLPVRGRVAADGDLRSPLGLSGPGPWLVVVTAPGCARCEPVARQLEQVAAGRPVLRVSLAERPSAAAVPVRSVPAVLAVGPDGRLVRSAAGALARGELAEIAAAV